MKVFQFKKDKNLKQLKFFNLNLFEKYKIRDENNIQILCGFIKYTHDKNYNRCIKIFNIPVFQKIKFDKDGTKYKKIYLFRCVDVKKIIREYFIDSVIKGLDREYKNIVLIRSAIGETYMLQFFLNEYMKQKGINVEDTCFVNWRESLGSIFKLYNPQINYKQIKFNVAHCFYCLDGTFYKYKDYDIHVFVDKDFIYNLMDKYKNAQTSNYYDELLNHYNIEKKNTNKLECIYSDYDVSIFREKIKYINLNLNNFILFSPEALSIELINKDFWLDLEDKLIRKGYDVYWNITDDSIFDSKKFTKLNLVEVKYLADMAKGIIGLSSGFIETLSRCNCKQSIIYTPLKLNGVSGQNMLKSHSKKAFPFVEKDNIFEFVYDKNNEKELINSILEVY